MIYNSVFLTWLIIFITICTFHLYLLVNGHSKPQLYPSCILVAEVESQYLATVLSCNLNNFFTSEFHLNFLAKRQSLPQSYPGCTLVVPQSYPGCTLVFPNCTLVVPPDRARAVPPDWAPATGACRPDLPYYSQPASTDSRPDLGLETEMSWLFQT